MVDAGHRRSRSQNGDQMTRGGAFTWFVLYHHHRLGGLSIFSYFSLVQSGPVRRRRVHGIAQEQRSVPQSISDHECPRLGAEGCSFKLSGLSKASWRLESVGRWREERIYPSCKLNRIVEARERHRSEHFAQVYALQYHYQELAYLLCSDQHEASSWPSV